VILESLGLYWLCSVPFGKEGKKKQNPTLWKNPAERDPVLDFMTFPFVSAGISLQPHVVCRLLKGVKQVWDKQCHELF